MRARWMTFVAFALVLAASAGAAKWSADASTRHSRDQLEAVAVASAEQQRENSLAGCERTLADRRDAIKGWTTARVTRIATAHNPDVPTGERLAAAGAAATYRDVVRSYRSRLVTCTDAFPPINTAIVRRAVRHQIAP
jgi:hypothetical protein